MRGEKGDPGDGPSKLKPGNRGLNSLSGLYGECGFNGKYGEPGFQGLKRSAGGMSSIGESTLNGFTGLKGENGLDGLSG